MLDPGENLCLWHVFNLEVVKMYDVYSEMPGSNGSVGDVYLIFEHLGRAKLGIGDGMGWTLLPSLERKKKERSIPGF